MQSTEAISLFKLSREARGLTEKSIKGYLDTIGRFHTTTGYTKTEDYTKENINRWVVSMHNLKPVTANRYIRDVRAYLYYLMDEGYIPTYKIQTLRAQEPPLKYYTDEELEKLLTVDKEIEFVEYRTYVMICFALATGARIGTIVNVMVNDIDFASSTIRYQHTKNKHSATVPLSPKLGLILKSYITNYQLTDYLFPNTFGEPLCPDAALEALIDYCTKRGVERHSWHSFRHNFAKNWLLSGGDIARLQVMLQHSSITQTQHYARIFGVDIGQIDNLTVLDKLKPKKERKYR